MNNRQYILGLDPSSTVVGYAVKGVDGTLVEAGLILPDRRSAGSFERIVSMRQYLNVVFDRFRPGIVIIEWTKGKVGRRRHHGLGAGLAVYGCGVGAMATECDIWCRKNGAELIAINENTWTRGVPKGHRQLAIAQHYESYRPQADPGGDIADAIGIIDYWLKVKLTTN